MSQNEKVGCKFCSQTPVFLDGEYYDRYRSSKEFVNSGYEAAYIAANEEGTIVMYVCGDGISDDYPLNYCPECGRYLGEEKKG